MATLRKFKLSGERAGEVSVDDDLLNLNANSQMIKDYIVALRQNARQWSASTRTRGEVAHSNKKPHAQKKTGKARQGRLSSPQYKGGGCVHGPRPKFDQHVRINRKERQLAVRSLIADKMSNGQVIVLEDTSMANPRTKTVVELLKAAELEGRVLFMAEADHIHVATETCEQVMTVSTPHHDNFIKSVRNLPRIEFSLAANVSGYDVIKASTLVMTEAALRELQWIA